MREAFAIASTLILAFFSNCVAEEFEIEIPKDPFRPDFPRYLKAPADSVFDAWTYIVRVNEYTHARTPIVTEIRASEDETRVTTLRLTGGEIDLSYSFTMKHKTSLGRKLPEWATTLDETDDVSGLDGTITTVEIFTRNTSKYISRWGREYRESARGLTGLNKWIDFFTRYTGVVARPYLPPDADTEQGGADQPEKRSESIDSPD